MLYQHWRLRLRFQWLRGASTGYLCGTTVGAGELACFGRLMPRGDLVGERVRAVATRGP